MHIIFVRRNSEEGNGIKTQYIFCHLNIIFISTTRQIIYRVSQKNIPVIFPVTTGTILYAHGKQRQIWNPHYLSFSWYILFLFYPFPIISIRTTTNTTPTLLCSVSQTVTEQCEYPALYHDLLDICNIKSYLKV